MVITHICLGIYEHYSNAIASKELGSIEINSLSLQNYIGKYFFIYKTCKYVSVKILN